MEIIDDNVYISVIVPIYRVEKYIQRCIASIINQTMHEFELILVDNASDDRSIEIALREIETRGLRAKVVHLKENVGPGGARNHGLLHATGTYIAFIDSDDYIEADYLQSLYNKAKMTQADIVVCGYEHVSENKKILKRFIPKDGQFTPFLVMASWAHLYKKEFIDKHSISFLETLYGEDVYFNLKAISCTNNIAVLPKCGYQWIINLQSVSNTIHKKIDISDKEKNPFFLLDTLYNEILPEKWTDQYFEYNIARFLCYYILYIVRSNSPIEVERMYKKTIEWLIIHNSNYRNNLFLRKRCPEGEDIKIHFLVKWFYHLDRKNITVNLLKIIAFFNK